MDFWVIVFVVFVFVVVIVAVVCLLFVVLSPKIAPHLSGFSGLVAVGVDSALFEQVAGKLLHQSGDLEKADILGRPNLDQKPPKTT